MGRKDRPRASSLSLEAGAAANQRFGLMSVSNARRAAYLGIYLSAPYHNLRLEGVNRVMDILGPCFCQAQLPEQGLPASITKLSHRLMFAMGQALKYPPEALGQETGVESGF